MIPLAELRIGNIVSFDLHEQEIANLEIMEFASRNGKPIPISEGWLVKFGFHSDHVMYWLLHVGKMRFHFSKDLSEFGCTFEGEMLTVNHIKFVHQLQNLYFALTQHELTISENIPA